MTGRVELSGWPTLLDTPSILCSAWVFDPADPQGTAGLTHDDVWK
jgi:hypothetical protein